VTALKLPRLVGVQVAQGRSPRRSRRGRIEAFSTSSRATSPKDVLHGARAVAALKQVTAQEGGRELAPPLVHMDRREVHDRYFAADRK
jgi:hypothetical protein